VAPEGTVTGVALLSSAEADEIERAAPCRLRSTFDPSDATGQSVYVATRSHGLWRTPDGGLSWQPVTAIPFLGT